MTNGNEPAAPVNTEAALSNGVENRTADAPAPDTARAGMTGYGDSPGQGLPAVTDTPAPALNITRAQAGGLLAVCAGLALLYAVCFSGFGVLPLFSFTLFVPVAFAALTLTLRRLGLFRNPRAFGWALPIAALAVMNGLNSVSPFTYGNVIAAHGLFAVYALTAMNALPIDLYNPGGLYAVTRVLLGGWGALPRMLRLFKKPRAAGTPRRWPGVLAGALAALPVLLVVGTLLASADAMFGRYMRQFVSFFARFDWANPASVLCFAGAFWYACGYVFTARRTAEGFRALPFPQIRVSVAACAAFLAPLNLVFLLFTFVQCAFLFNGGFLRLPEGMAYAEYAREGFFQLLFVTVINFGVILLFVTVLNDGGNGICRRRPVRFLLLVLCAFTGVLIASSFYRMGLYTGAYGHTTLRLAVYSFLCMEVVLLVLTVWKLMDARVPYIRFGAAVMLVSYLTVNVTASDYVAAALNRRLFERGRLPYLDVRPLGVDGLTALRPLFEDGRYVCANYRLMTAEDYASGRGLSDVPRPEGDNMPQSVYEELTKPQDWETLYRNRAAGYNRARWQNWTLWGRE